MKMTSLIREERFYHGTGGAPFQKFRTPEVYLTKDQREAMGFAKNVHLGGATGGAPRVLNIEARPGSTLDAEDIVMEILMDEHPEFRDIDDIMPWARQQGHRYVTFSHPSMSGGADNFEVTVSLYPNQDLRILK